MSTKAIFSYGSNSVAQLRGRVLNYQLKSEPAYVENMARVFCYRAAGWGDGGVASLAPFEGTRTYGTLVELTEQELERLNAFEKGYSLKEIEVYTGQPTIKREALVYLANDPVWQTAPSEQYLTAIHHMLREHYPDVQPISVNRVTRASSGRISMITSGAAALTRVEHVYDWYHPGTKQLTLESLCVEANAKREVPWAMPATMNSIVKTLRSNNISSTADLIQLLSSDDNSDTVQKLSSELNDESILDLFKIVLDL